MNTIVIVICLLVMLIGLAGTILPILPGLPIIWLSSLGYGLYSGWISYGATTMVVTGILVVLCLIMEQLASVVGAKKFGATRAGMIGAVAGAIVGLIVFNIIGLILGTFLGAMGFEMLFSRRNIIDSMASGFGALLGFLAGSLFKFMMGLGLILYFLYAVIF